MSADDPRVRRAREAADYPTTGHDMHGILCDLLAVVDEQRATIAAEAEWHKPDTCDSLCTTCWQDWPCPIVQAAGTCP